MINLQKDFEGLNSQISLLEEKYGVKIEIEIEPKPKAKLPTSIFTKQLGISESIVKYLKENESMTNSEVAEILHTNPNNIAVTYHKAKQKISRIFINHDFSHAIPLNIFDKKTPLQSVVIYYRKKGFSFSKIGKILDRRPGNIRVVYENSLCKNAR